MTQHTPSSIRKHAWREVLRLFIASSPRRLLLGCLLSACTALMGCVLLGISGWFLTATYIAGLSAGTAIMFDVFMPSASIRLLAIGRTASRYAERLVTHDATFTVLVNLREKLFTGWSQPQALKQLQLRPARILFRLTRDLDALQAMYLRMLLPVAAAITTACIVGIILMFFNLWLGIGVFIVMSGIGLGIGWLIAQRSTLASARTLHAVEQLRACAVDLVAGQTDLVMADRLAAQQDKLMAADTRLQKADLAVNRAEILGNWSFGMFQSVTLACALLVAVWLMELGIVSAAGAAFVVLLIWSVCEAFNAIKLGALESGKTRVAARRLAPRLSPQTIPATHTPGNLTDTHNALLAKQLGFSYAANTAASASPTLKDISLTIAPGEHVALVGPSGCGKSTLLGLITGELSVQHGQLSSNAVSWLPQRTALFQDTVRGNLNLAHLPVSDETLWHALAQAGLKEDIATTKAGLDTRLGEGGMGLSGGQSRRLALARLFLTQPDFWVLDEPTEGLDTHTATEVLACLSANMDKRTLLVATHLRREALLADRLILMRDGMIVADERRGSNAYHTILAGLREG